MSSVLPKKNSVALNGMPAMRMNRPEGGQAAVATGSSWARQPLR
jgi:hypothetical protein